LIVSLIFVNGKGDTMSVKVGERAPKFTLVDTNLKERSLDEFLGKKVVLAFYPGAFTSVCTKEMCTFRDMLSKLETLDAQVIGISVDGPFANKAFAQQNKLTFPILCDYTRSVSKQYSGVHEDFVGIKGYSVSKRAVFVLDKDGVVRYSWISEDPGKEPNYDEITEALNAIR